MAQIANTYETYDVSTAGGNREELADKIYQITPEETPFISLIGRKPVASTHPEWLIDSLASIDLNNNQPEGNDWTFQSITPPSRVGNYTQISDKKIIVSRTQDKTLKAGRKSELAREVAKKGVELRTDMEGILLSNQASLAGSGNAATNRKLGGFRAWLATNDSIGGGGGASGGFNTSTNVVDAATNGTQRAFTKTILDAVILSTYNAGGSPKTLMLSPYAKTVFSTFMADSNVAPQRYETPRNGQTTIVAAADMYLSDFGSISVVPNRQMARAGATVARNAFLIDPKMVSLGVFDDISLEKPAKTGDAEKRVLVTEYTLLVNNEAAHGVAADIFGLTSAS
ncbi:DUF5309 domain-containing protein [Bradyrhizobium sp. SZCCHNRI1073]|uniref:DUF5309 domain-containing protein n=1 Tax=Bradyrhizobium sp. SZCCHNRI1073 TaxID=3057280 RepID=UPI0029165CED|nr:DUF5309 domain-containing protein [Bradyrhizobium sp. SZCCHNRI1073]